MAMNVKTWYLRVLGEVLNIGFYMLDSLCRDNDLFFKLKTIPVNSKLYITSKNTFVSPCGVSENVYAYINIYWHMFFAFKMACGP